MELVECASLLASAILERAVEDWRELIRKRAWLDRDAPYLASDPIPNSYCNFDELRAFFKGDWCEALCELVSDNVCSNTILKILEKELAEAKAKESFQ